MEIWHFCLFHVLMWGRCGAMSRLLFLVLSQSRKGWSGMRVKFWYVGKGFSSPVECKTTSSQHETFFLQNFSSLRNDIEEVSLKCLWIFPFPSILILQSVFKNMLMETQLMFSLCWNHVRKSFWSCSSIVLTPRRPFHFYFTHFYRWFCRNESKQLWCCNFLSWINKALALFIIEQTSNGILVPDIIYNYETVQHLIAAWDIVNVNCEWACQHIALIWAKKRW